RCELGLEPGVDEVLQRLLEERAGVALLRLDGLDLLIRLVRGEASGRDRVADLRLQRVDPPDIDRIAVAQVVLRDGLAVDRRNDGQVVAVIACRGGAGEDEQRGDDDDREADVREQRAAAAIARAVAPPRVRAWSESHAEADPVQGSVQRSPDSGGAVSYPMAVKSSGVGGASDPSFHGRRILVTGGSGSIGSRLVDRLMDHGPDVV